MAELIGAGRPRGTRGRKRFWGTLSHGGAAALLAVITAASTVSAQSGQERADARAAATEGLRAFNNGQYQEALDLFRSAEMLVHAPPHVLYQARASAKLGHLVAARELYRKIAIEVIAPDAPAAFRGAQAAAQQELPEVESRIATVRLKIEGAGSDPVTVTMDDTQVPTGLLGLPRSVDPGEHKFQARSKGLASEVQTVQLGDSVQQLVTLTLVPAKDEPAPLPAAAPTTTAPQTGAPPPPAADEGTSHGGGGLRIASFVSIGVGVVGLGAGTLFALSSSKNRKDADSLCNADGSGQCHAVSSQRAQIDDLYAKAGTGQTLSLVGFIVGGVGLAAGGTLFFLSTRSSTSGTSSDLHAWVGPRGVGLSGRF